MLIRKRICVVVVLVLAFASAAHSQSLGTAGTVEGTIVDPSGAVITNAQVALRNPITGFQRMVTTD